MSSEKIILEFRDNGGYDHMTGAWSILKVKDDKGYQRTQLVLIDQAEFGQDLLDYDFRSEEAKLLAEAVFKAVKRFYENRHVQGT